VLVVDEHHAVTDEDLVIDLDAVADERVALDTATGTDPGTPLDLDVRAHPGVVSDRATIEIGELKDDDPVTEGDVVDHAVRRVVGRTVSH
jgi:hypothetical protein